MSVPDVNGYLSSRAFLANSVEPRVGVSLRSMLLDVLPRSREYIVRAIAHMAPGSEVMIDIELETVRGKTLGSLRRVGREFRIFRCNPLLIPVLEQLDAAAFAWNQYIRAKLGELGTQVIAHCYPDDTSDEPCQRSVIKLDMVATCLRDLLDQFWKEPRGRFDRWGRRVAVTLSGKPTLTFDVGFNQIKSLLIRGKVAAPAMEAVRTLNQHFLRSIAGERWLVYFRGDVLMRGHESKEAELD